MEKRPTLIVFSLLSQEKQGKLEKNRLLLLLREAKPGGFQTGGGVSHFFQEWSRLCRRPFRDCSSSLLLIGCERGKGTNRENPRTIPEQIGKIPEKSGKSQKRTKKDKKGRTSPDRETPPFETPPFSGLLMNLCQTRKTPRGRMGKRSKRHKEFSLRKIQRQLSLVPQLNDYR